MAKQTKAATVAAPKKTATVSGPTAQAVNKAIAAAQIAQPHAEYIYVDLKGDYHLHPRPGFTKVDMADGEVIVERERTIRPIKLPTPASTPAVDNDADIEGDEDVQAPNDGKEF